MLFLECADVLLQVPTVSLTLVLELVELGFSSTGLVVDCVDTKIMIEEGKVGLSPIPPPLKWLNVHPAFSVPGPASNQLPDLPIVMDINW